MKSTANLVTYMRSSLSHVNHKGGQGMCNAVRVCARVMS